MWEAIILLLIYLVVGLAGLAVAGWGVAAGQFFTMDGLFLVLVSLTLAVVFLTAFALGVRSGEFGEVLGRLRRPKRSPAPSGAAQPDTASKEPGGKTSQAGSAQKA